MREPAAPATPEWLPSPEQGCRPAPCGRWWDAVTVDSFDGTRALAHLRSGSGPILEDEAAGTMTWLVAAGTTAGWELRGVVLLRQGSRLTVPPAAGAGSLRWQRLPPGRRGWLTRPTLLHGALSAALGARREEARRG